MDPPTPGPSRNHRHDCRMASFGADAAAVINHLDLNKVRIIEDVYHAVPWESREQLARYLKESIEDIRSLSPAS